VLSSDGTVLTCLPGFWNPQDLVGELQLAEDLNRVWINPNLSRAQKDNSFRALQLGHIRQHSPQLASRSQMQGFDKQFEVRHGRHADVFEGGQASEAAIKTTDVIMHERMARQPFVPYDQFNVAAFVDYGRQQYDKNENMRTADGQMSTSKQMWKGVSKGALQVLNHL
jgi:hypothetical protein